MWCGSTHRVLQLPQVDVLHSSLEGAQTVAELVFAGVAEAEVSDVAQIGHPETIRASISKSAHHLYVSYLKMTLLHGRFNQVGNCPGWGGMVQMPSALLSARLRCPANSPVWDFRLHQQVQDDGEQVVGAHRLDADCRGRDGQAASPFFN